MSDIVKELREFAVMANDGESDHPLANQAADEITRLREYAERLTKYVEHMLPYMEDEHCPLCQSAHAALAMNPTEDPGTQSGGGGQGPALPPDDKPSEHPTASSYLWAVAAGLEQIAREVEVHERKRASAPRAVVTEDMVNRFLVWKLPNSVLPDGCVMDRAYPYRTGTNLLTATEARAMLEHVLGCVHEERKEP